MAHGSWLVARGSWPVIQRWHHLVRALLQEGGVCLHPFDARVVLCVHVQDTDDGWLSACFVSRSTCGVVAIGTTERIVVLRGITHPLDAVLVLLCSFVPEAPPSWLLLAISRLVCMAPPQRLVAIPTQAAGVLTGVWCVVACCGARGGLGRAGESNGDCWCDPDG